MTGRRMTLLATCLVVAALAVWFAIAKSDNASKMATFISTLAAVAAVGVGLLAAWPGVSSGTRARASRTGRAVGRGGGTATTGIIGSAGHESADLRVDRTGDAEASDGGEATSGIHLN